MDTRLSPSRIAPPRLRWLVIAGACLASGAPCAAQPQPERPLILRVTIERTPVQSALADLHGAQLRSDPAVLDEAQLKRRWSHLMRIELDKGESLSFRPRKGGLMLSYRVEFD